MTDANVSLDGVLASVAQTIAALEERVRLLEMDQVTRFPKPFRVVAVGGGVSFSFSRDDTGATAPSGI